MNEIVAQSNAESVLANIDRLIIWERNAVEKLETGWVRLASLLLEAKRGEYWKVRGMTSEEEYINAVFPDSRSNYFALIAIVENLTPHLPRELLESLGRSKCEDMVRIQRQCGLVPEKWILHAKQDSKRVFRRRVRDFVATFHKPQKTNGQPESSHPAEREPEVEDEILKFRIFGNGILIVRRALDTARMMLGTDKSMGYLLENICADFCAGVYSPDEPMIGNGFRLMIIQHALESMEWNEETANRLISMIAATLEKRKDFRKEQTCESQDAASWG